jgi:hypothetical protein
LFLAIPIALVITPKSLPKQRSDDHFTGGIAAMEYLIRFSQSHETFRVPEIQALAELGKIDLKVLYYDPEVSYHGPKKYT